MLIVVSYDISDDRRRLRLADALKDFGERVQLSVFECHLDDRQLDRLRHRVVSIIEAAQDSVRIYRLCASCHESLETLGQAEKTGDPKVYIV